jgi:hypothetical protein
MLVTSILWIAAFLLLPPAKKAMLAKRKISTNLLAYTLLAHQTYLGLDEFTTREARLFTYGYSHALTRFRLSCHA